MPMDEALHVLASHRVYFAHQSVGDDIIGGAQAILREHPDATIRVVETREPARINGPAFMHFHVGTNEAPHSKNDDLLTVLDSRAHRDSAIVLMKYCYIDVNRDTDAAQLFRGYRALVDSVRTRHPDLRIVHATIPLTIDASGIVPGLKRLLGRTTARELNATRNAFNEMLRREFASEPIFDIAALESTRNTDFTSSTPGESAVPSLQPEYTTDGGHLNEQGARRLAEHLFRVLAATAEAR
jgi:lysophospholipase L1-like esterase